MEEETLARIEAAVAYLEAEGRASRQDVVTRMLGTRVRDLAQYPHCPERLAQLAEHRRAQQRTRTQAQQLVARVQAAEQRVTWQAISAHFGISDRGLEHYPQVEVILKEVGTVYRTHSRSTTMSWSWLHRSRRQSGSCKKAVNRSYKARCAA